MRTTRTPPPTRGGACWRSSTDMVRRTEGKPVQPLKIRQLARENSAIQLVSQVVPPSVENAWSQRAVVAVISDHTYRTWIGLPSYTSGLVNTPRPSSPNRPTTGGSDSPLRLLAQYSDHSSLDLSYRRSVTPPNPWVGNMASSKLPTPSRTFHDRWTPGNSYQSSLSASGRRNRRWVDVQLPTNQSKLLSMAGP